MNNLAFHPYTLVLVAMITMSSIGLGNPEKIDDRGWNQGTPAVNASTYQQPFEPVAIDLPEEVRTRIQRPTILYYFSPTCPHCKSVALEINQLSERVSASTDVLGVASGHQPPKELELYQASFPSPFPILYDKGKHIAGALGIRSTPSALLVQAGADGRIYVHDFWYPYRNGYDKLIEMRVASSPWTIFEENKYLGNTVCATCHLHEAESWVLTHHSVAFATLIKQDKHKDPQCIGCHVTGYQQPSGWSGETSVHLIDVGCESCHGPGGPHDGISLQPKSTCQQCHDAKHSIAFDYGTGLAAIDHYQATTLSDEEFLEIRKALSAGTLARPLIGFPDAENMGSAPCKTCHEPEYAQWKSSPHSKAMALLNKDESQQRNCVRCHATGKRAGPTPTDPTQFHLDESVGCESCHGPGGAHIAAGGGKDNIEGLGEDCAVCVIEALCTTCHTEEWDPLFDLEPRLKAVHHTAPTTMPSESSPKNPS